MTQDEPPETTDRLPAAHGRAALSVLKVVSAYAIFAALWILLSDSAVEAIFKEPHQITLASTIKGWAFVGVTSLLLYGLVSRLVHQLAAAHQQAIDAISERQRVLALLENVVNSSNDAIFAKDLDGRYLLFNRAAARVVGKSPEAVIGHDDRAIFPAAQAEMLMTNDRALAREERTATKEEFLDTAMGRRVFQATKGPLRNEAGTVIGTFGISRDITELRSAEDDLHKLSLAVDQSPESVIITDAKGRIEYVNESLLRKTGYRRDEFIGQTPALLRSPQTTDAQIEEMWQALVRGEVWQGEFCNRRKDGGEYVDRAVISPIRQKDGRISHFLSIQEDITEKKAREAEIYRLAFHDPLTALPNRALLLDRIAQALAGARRSAHIAALLSFNVDRFKMVNDAGGQSLGDSLLKEIARRSTQMVREGDAVARISGDEFAILLTDLSPHQEAAAAAAMHVAAKLHEGIGEAFVLGSEEVSISVSVGIALLPEGASDTPLDALRRSNTALHQSKRRGTGETTFFEPTLDEVARQRFDTERELKRAIAENQLRVYLQPQVDAQGAPVAAEALIRWQHPTRGLIPPGAFIPIAEESHLIIDLGDWMLRQVCALLARPPLATLPLRIAINISPRHFRQPDFVAQFRQCLVETGADPTHMTLEITEGLVIDNIGDVVAKMNELSALGVHFSMDDFGTGYSSLSYLKRLPIHEIKIDKSFVQDVTSDPNDAALVETILTVAQLLRIRVVAEGVETREQADFLNARGPVIHQGYFFGRPEPAEQVIARLG